MAWFGTGEARLCSLVSKDRAYKPVVKSSGAQRKSDGVVVPMIAASNAAGGKDPDFGHAGNEGTSEGMAGTARPISPLGQPSQAKVRRLQNRLWAAAKQSKGRAFHALYDRIYRDDILWEAWERVRANRGAAGVDQITIAAVEAYGAERMVAELQNSLRAGSYRPAPVRRVEIPKPDGSKRPLGIPTVKDRVCQQAAKLVLEPIFEADFSACSFGFRPKRSATDAMERLRIGFIEGSQVGQQLPDVIARLNRFLRGWGNYFRTGNAAAQFAQLDRYLVWRLRRLLVKQRGRNLRAGQANRWQEDWFHDQGLHQLRGTIRYPKAA